MDIFQFYELSRTKGEIIYIPVRNSSVLRNIEFSTRTNNIIFGGTVYTTEKNRDFVDSPLSANVGTAAFFSPNFEGDVPVLLKGGKSDVFSVFISQRFASGTYRHYLNIQNFGNWINQFTNCYSFLIDTGAQGVNTDIIKGDFSQIPDSLERFKITTMNIINLSTDVFLNISNFSPNSKLKYLNLNSLLKFSGDLKYIPPMCNFFSITNTQAGNFVSYTTGKIWANSFDTLYLPIALTKTENDNILIDMSNSITAAIGGKIIRLLGTRSAASNTAVIDLQTKGFTVTPASAT